MTFEEKMNEVITNLNSTLSKESTKEEIDKVRAIEKGIGEMKDIHTKLNSDYEGVKTDYINLMKESGNRNESGGVSGDSGKKQVDVDDVKSLEEDMKKFVSKEREANK